MSSNSQSVNPVKDLLDRIGELERILDMRMLGPSLMTQNQLWALGNVLDRYSSAS